MSDTLEVIQKGNTVGGHQAGRDVIVTVAPPRRTSLMQTLIAQFESEKASNPDFSSIVDSLQHFLNQKLDLKSQTVIGLEGKLKLAGREDEVEEAARLKEIFVKKLESHRLSQSAQRIYAYALGRIFLLFRAEIRPMLSKKESPEQVDAAILKKVFEPVFNELEDNVLLIDYQEIAGMLFYLTGNCHLRWD